MARRRTGHGERRHTTGGESGGHVLGVGDGDTEPESAHSSYIIDLVLKLSEDDAHAGVVGGVDAGEGGDVVVALAPVDMREVCLIADAEVVERAEQVGLECFPQAQLGGGAAVEPLVAYIDAVAALGGGGEAEEFGGGQVIEDAAVRRGLGVVELVDHDHLEGIRGKAVEAVQALNACEDVAPEVGCLPVDVQLTEGAVGEDLAVGTQGLVEDLFAVRDKQQRRAAQHACVVESGDDGLTSAGRGDDEVAVAVVDLAFDLEVVEDLGLVRVGADLQAADRERGSGAVGLAARDGEGLVEPVRVRVGVVGEEGVIGPQPVEGGDELGEELGGVLAGEADVPLEAVAERGAAKPGSTVDP